MERDGLDALVVSEKNNYWYFGGVNQDIAMANTIYQSAVEKGIGTRLPY